MHTLHSLAHMARDTCSLCAIVGQHCPHTGREQALSLRLRASAAAGRPSPPVPPAQSSLSRHAATAPRPWSSPCRALTRTTGWRLGLATGRLADQRWAPRGRARSWVPVLAGLAYWAGVTSGLGGPSMARKGEARLAVHGPSHLVKVIVQPRHDVLYSTWQSGERGRQKIGLDGVLSRQMGRKGVSCGCAWPRYARCAWPCRRYM